jgi:putative membrane protein
MAISESDPRVFFAAERTLLAWLRTGLTIIALGFVVSRFGLFVQLLATQGPNVSAAGRASLSGILGVIFVVIGSVAIAASAIQHRRFTATLSQADLPAQYSRSFALVLALTVAALGLTLAGYLVFASN